MTKLWQLMQSRDTENLNLDKDLEEILSKMKQMGGSEEDKTTRHYGHKPKVRISKYRRPEFQPQDLRQRDESVTECLYACLQKGARKGV